MTRVMNRSVESLIVAYRRDGDINAREQVLVELLPVVRALASRYAGRGEPLDDLVQVGAVGLIKALDRFDIDRGVNFTSYAIPTVIGEIRRYFRDRAWALHIPRPIKELSVRLNKVVDQLTSDLGRPRSRSSPRRAERPRRT
jgi:RNA polymerase sigma-B factor